ncbi:MAG TPA: S8 family serine peptidase, partial [Acidimicrobiales bacterium]|nr:S8 family serine peptidase [Acidimicrobiales bacterium]
PEAQLIDALAEKYNVVWTIAAGNQGPTLQSLGSPATASQSIAVGASVADWDRFHATDDTLHGMHGNVLPDSAKAQNPHAIANFSSRGPSGDRLIKPDITAPGAYVVSVEASTGGEVHAGDAAVNNNYSSDPNYAVLSGTSMAAPSAAGAAALVIDGYHKATGNNPAYYVLKAAMANTADANTFEGPITGLISSIKANDLGMDPESLFPSRNDGEVGVTGVGAGRVNVPNAVLASSAGVVAYTPRVRNSDGLLTINAWQPSWSLQDVAPGESRSQHFILRGGPNLPQNANVTFAVESGPEASGIQAAPASWFSLPASATAVPGSPAGGFDVSLNVPGGNIAPGQYTANIIATADLGGGNVEHLRIPVSFFVPMTTGSTITGPIWASDTTDYSIVGFENPEGQIYSDWSMVPMRVPTSAAGTSLTFNVWDQANTSTMDVFVFDNSGLEVDSTVDEPLHAVPAGAALQPTSKDAPGTVSIKVVKPGATLGFGEVHAGDVVWLVLSDTKPKNPAQFETYNLSVS